MPAWLFFATLACYQPPEPTYVCTCELTVTDSAGEEVFYEDYASVVESEEEAQIYVDETCPDLCEAYTLESGEAYDCAVSCVEGDKGG